MAGPFLLRLYPAAWRARYGDEFAELLLARPPSGRDRLDVARAAIDARLHPQLADEPRPPRVATTGDRVLALAGVTAGVLFGIWGAVIAIMSPQWGSMGLADEALVGAGYAAGLVGLILAIGVLLGLANRYVEDLGSMGTFGAVVAAAGFVFTIGGASSIGILLATGGTLAMAPGLARRVVPWPIAAGLAGATAFLALGMFGFVGSNGQDLLWLFLLMAYGPAWAGLGLSLRRGRPASRIVAALAT